MWTSNFSSICVDCVCLCVSVFFCSFVFRNKTKQKKFDYTILCIAFVSSGRCCCCFEQKYFCCTSFFAICFAIFFPFSPNINLSFVSHSLSQLKKTNCLLRLLLASCALVIVTVLLLVLLLLLFSPVSIVSISHRNAFSFERINVEQSTFISPSICNLHK